MLNPEVCDKCWAKRQGAMFPLPPCAPEWYCRRDWEDIVYGKDILLTEESSPPKKCPRIFEHAISAGRSRVGS
jgi:hypothetical protein